MIGTTLTEIREQIENLASADGQYYIVCGRTRDRPVPTTDLTFESRTVARAALRATEQYRAALRRYDPRLPYYDLIVCERTTPETGYCRDDDWTFSEPVVTRPDPETRVLVEFCHRVAAAIFETLSAGGYSAVESAVMEEYFELAETIAEPDQLCFRLLESMTIELGTALDPAEQAAVLATAGSRLPPVESTTNPVDATCGNLRQSGFITGYSYSPLSVDRENSERSVAVEFSGYPLSVQDGRLPALPFVLDLYRRELDWEPAELLVEPVEDGWRLTIALADTDDPADLIWAPVHTPHP